ncbi:MAG: hypothetical protein RBS96_09205, partial [Dehalococcoidales bacterium]|nr:hypothetical protein [Dehalococcoidales bacterium]
MSKAHYLVRGFIANQIIASTHGFQRLASADNVHSENLPLPYGVALINVALLLSANKDKESASKHRIGLESEVEKVESLDVVVIQKCTGDLRNLLKQLYRFCILWWA